MVDEEGYFGTDLPIILHQMLSEILSVAKKISVELKDEVFNVIVEEMKSFSQSFIKELTEFQRKVSAFLSLFCYFFFLILGQFQTIFIRAMVSFQKKNNNDPKVDVPQNRPCTYQEKFACWEILL